jgi:hypothetical protein
MFFAFFTLNQQLIIDQMDKWQMETLSNIIDIARLTSKIAYSVDFPTGYDEFSMWFYYQKCIDDIRPQITGGKYYGKKTRMEAKGIRHSENDPRFSETK